MPQQCIPKSRDKICSGAGDNIKIICRSSATAAERGNMPQQCIPKSRDKICSGAGDNIKIICRSSASRKVGTRSAAERVITLR
jgi:hypothetical protein